MTVVKPGFPFAPHYRGLAPGTRLNGIYEIDQMIGAGGMGEVYRCHEIQTGAVVAIKMLLPDMAENEAALALFRREAAALLNLLHEAIVRYFVFTIEPTLQRPYLAMEFVEGRPLSDMLGEGPLAFEALLKLMGRIALGLQAAHERGIIHRDVSPDNIIIPLGDVTRAKIIDFGIARSTQFGDKTIIGSGFAGKDNYVSPEQVGLYGSEITARSDIYSLGLLLFYALTGQKLEMGGSQLQLVQKRQRVPDLGGVDQRIRPLLERMLQPDPANRPATMAEIANWRVSAPSSRALNPLHRPKGSTSLPGENEAAAPNRRRAMFAASIVALVIGAMGAAFYNFAWLAPGSYQPPPLPDPKRLSELPAAAPPTSGAARERVRRYIERYDGGDCFLVLPVAISPDAAVVEGLGASTAPFDAFDKAFKRDIGFEVSIGLRQVTQAQCPAIKFLNQLGINRVRAPRVSLASSEVTNGETLNGTIENPANRVIELLLVSDSGNVQNRSYLLKPGTDSFSFSIEMKRSDDARGPQLVMAIATPSVLESLRQSEPMAADTFFLEAMSEAQHNNVTISAAARYFRFNN